MNDRTNRLLGWARMRQLRVKSNTCTIPKSIQNLILNCYDDYNFFNEEKRSFQPGWTTSQTNQTYNQTINRAFIYQTSDQLDSNIYTGIHHTYNSGGYVYEFRGRFTDIQNNISILHQLQWIDNQTRAIFIEFSLYNPNSQLFISSNLLVEFLSSTWIEPQLRFDPISFQSNSFHL